jgi:hypothetical protein
MKVAAPNCSRHWMDAVDSDGRRQAGATGIMLAHGQMTVAAPAVTDTVKGTVGVVDQPERPGKCYHTFGDWRGKDE